ncbi:hypothetical protein BOX15_Mlig010031g2 [Macrostomum lignano]|uniref:ATP-grasp domain-containing protein n=2 Tax=Macrostomum lignano TaxID=282301 RepID=A0A267GL30_9PLAT|nr:hypothetical protein BOX15_Mlig010031g2 [Macrostomum lignano]
MACVKSSSASILSTDKQQQQQQQQQKPQQQQTVQQQVISPCLSGSAGASPSYPDDVPATGSYPLRAWTSKMFRNGFLSDMGFCSLSYPDGKAMVQEVFNHLGWASVANFRTQHPYQPGFFWCHGYTAKSITEWRQSAKFTGLQFVSSLPNIICLHNKKLLQTLIRQYEQSVLNSVGSLDAPNYLRFPGDIRAYNSDAYLPRTLFDLTHEELHHIAESCFKQDSVWIAKPLSQNCGKGICLVRSREQLLELSDRLPNLIVQEYIRNPVTLDGRKSDLRVYLLLVCPERGHLMAFYHPGFVRLSLRQYAETTDDLAVHLTNQSVAKATEEWTRRRDESTWTPAQMNNNLNARRDSTGFERDFLFRRVHPSMRAVLGIVSRAAYPKVTRIGGCFEFLGCDFMLDTSGRVWLIEINCYPGMATSTSLLRTLKPQVVHEAICLSMECISKQYQGKAMYPLESLRQFQLLWNSDDEPSSS